MRFSAARCDTACFTRVRPSPRRVPPPPGCLLHGGEARGRDQLEGTAPVGRVLPMGHQPSIIGLQEGLQHQAGEELMLRELLGAGAMAVGGQHGPSDDPRRHKHLPWRLAGLAHTPCYAPPPLTVRHFLQSNCVHVLLFAPQVRSARRETSAKMQYFRMTQSCDPGCAIVDFPVDSEGRAVMSGRPLECVGPVVAELVFPELTRLRDLLLATGELIVSQHAAGVITKFQLPRGWQALPCRVVTEQQQVLQECVCLHFPEVLHILDKEKSEFKPMPHQGRGPVTRPVLSRAAIEPYDLCSSVYVSFVCSERLACAIQDEDLDGFVFTELECAG